MYQKDWRTYFSDFMLLSSVSVKSINCYNVFEIFCNPTILSLSFKKNDDNNNKNSWNTLV